MTTDKEKSKQEMSRHKRDRNKEKMKRRDICVSVAYSCRWYR